MPPVAKQAARLHVFQRSANWMIPRNDRVDRWDLPGTQTIEAKFVLVVRERRQQVGREEAQPRSGMQANPVYDNNHYLGADPDPNVRLDLRRDFEGRDF